MEKSGPLYFEEIGQNFEAFMSLYDVGRRTKLIKQLLPADVKQRSCIEIGCGTGAISKELLPLVHVLSVLDISEKLAARVGDNLGVSWYAGDACKIPFPAESFELVVSSECIEHTENPREALREMCRVLTPGGYLCVTSPNKLWYPVLMIAQALKLRKFQGSESWLFPWEACKTITFAGCQIVVVRGCHLFPWQLPGAKSILPFFDRLARFLYPLMINYAILARKN